MTKRIENKVGEIMNISKIAGVNTAYKISAMKKDIQELEEKVSVAKEKYANLSEEMIAVSCQVCKFYEG